MSDFTDQIDNIQSSVDDHEDRLGTAEGSVDDHENRLSSVETSVGDGTTIGQLDFPLTQDSIDRIKEVFPTGTVTLSSGTAIVTNPMIGPNSIILYSVQTSNGIGSIGLGDPHLRYSYVLSAGSVTFNSSIGTDSSTLGYVIY